MSDEQEKEVSSGEKTTILSSEEAKAIAASATGKLITEDRTGPLKRSSAGKHAAPSSKNEPASLSEHSRRAAEWIAKKTETVHAVSKPAPTVVRGRKIRKSTLYLAATAALVVLIVLIAVILRTSTDAREYRNYYSLAQDCYTEHDYDTALTYLRKAARVNDGPVASKSVIGPSFLSLWR